MIYPNVEEATPLKAISEKVKRPDTAVFDTILYLLSNCKAVILAVSGPSFRFSW
jgi:hypothetical protein